MKIDIKVRPSSLDAPAWIDTVLDQRGADQPLALFKHAARECLRGQPGSGVYYRRQAEDSGHQAEWIQWFNHDLGGWYKIPFDPVIRSLVDTVLHVLVGKQPCEDGKHPLSAYEALLTEVFARQKEWEEGGALREALSGKAEN